MEWADVTPLFGPGVAVLALVVSTLTYVQASRWRARPYLEYKLVEVAGNVEAVPVEHVVDRAQATAGGVLVSTALDSVESKRLLKGLEIVVHNRGNAPAYGFELHVNAPLDRSGARMMLGSFVAIGDRSLQDGGEPVSVILCANRGYGSDLLGTGRWAGKTVKGLGTQPANRDFYLGRDLELWMTWREAPNVKRQRKQKLGIRSLGEWTHGARKPPRIEHRPA